jgi:energy-coupling factor transporter transmembrane protein EcfT
MEQSAPYTHLTAALKGLLLTASQIVQDIVAIAKLETRLAGINLVFIVLLIFTSSLICFAIWLSFLLAAAFGLQHLGFSWPMILLQVAGLNILLLVLVGWVIKRCIKNLSFTATRRQLSTNPLLSQGQHYVKTTQETNPIAGSESPLA